MKFGEKPYMSALYILLCCVSQLRFVLNITLIMSSDFNIAHSILLLLGTF